MELRDMRILCQSVLKFLLIHQAFWPAESADGRPPHCRMSSGKETKQEAVGKWLVHLKG